LLIIEHKIKTNQVFLITEGYKTWDFYSLGFSSPVLTQNTGIPLVGQKYVGHPEGVPQLLFPQNGLSSLGTNVPEIQTRIKISHLQEGIDLKLQIVCLKILHEVDIGAHVDVHR